MKNNKKISLVVLALIVGFVASSELRWFEPTNYLECKTNKGTFYLKIIQRTYTAEEYPNSKYKEDEIIKSFNVFFHTFIIFHTFIYNIKLFIYQFFKKLILN